METELREPPAAETDRATVADLADHRWMIRGITRDQRELIKGAADRASQSVAAFVVHLVEAHIRAERGGDLPAGEVLAHRALAIAAPDRQPGGDQNLAGLVAAALAVGKTPGASQLPRGLRGALMRRIRAELLAY
jgi:hypothetical protein